jgi:hypothetical protein
LYALLDHFVTKEIQMKRTSRFCAGVVLTLAFAYPTFAGHIPCPFTEPPPPPEERTAVSTKSVITETVITLFQSLMIGL